MDGNVSWCKLIWLSQNIPKHTFVFWKAVQNRLTTQDKVRQWGSYDLMICPLCYNDMDSHSHLFFKCKYAGQFWGKVLVNIEINCGNMEWNEIVNEFARKFNGNSIGSVIRRLSLAASVYLIWQERNNKLFRGKQRGWEELYKMFHETIRMRLMNLKVKPICKVQQAWDAKMKVVTNGTVADSNVK
ncbi:RNA-directed DNA polymerase, eukaryota, Reverse transcriptase zinc-binding domain protein [Artemisia annua]|uniref:RNA-directed DNA polymerase, eukaryota, Reverse transcriptase zinc-binding domain protein n=1 Tax=Artemisia annua TaxID=35608 RepID=A0A2U1MB62_ARTAN|nr:RNA-directed DNA polymerase, eukaryota, Reverse transcriptase zinc-binding domain protein [Artemisia annua]